MSKPAILTVDDDPVVAAAITRDLVGRYGADYRVVGATSGAEALVVLTRLALRDEPVALIAADQRMPEMTGIELLEQARDHAPGAKFLLLTAYADTEVAIRAINDIGFDYYLLKPWDPPDERLYPVTDDLLDDWRQANRERTSSDIRVIGHRWAGRPGCRGLCSIRGPEHRHCGARRPRWSGGTQRSDRELLGVSQGIERLRPRAARARSG